MHCHASVKCHSRQLSPACDLADGYMSGNSIYTLWLQMTSLADLGFIFVQCEEVETCCLAKFM